MAAWLLTVCGISLLGIGAFFVLARPALLPEDARFMGSTPKEISRSVPGLDRWLHCVFWVLGGYIATTGLLILYVANTALRSGYDSALVALALAGLTSVGWMTAVNFVIRSDFKWALVCLDLIWALGLLLAAAAR